MTPWMFWIITATCLAVLEMLSGTFYLLVLAVGAGVGAAVAGLGAGLAIQVSAVALVTASGWVALYKFGPHQSRREAASNPDVNPDIGAVVRIAQLSDTGIHKVLYRGTSWGARVEQGQGATGQDYTIVRVEGAVLILCAK